MIRNLLGVMNACLVLRVMMHFSHSLFFQLYQAAQRYKVDSGRMRTYHFFSHIGFGSTTDIPNHHAVGLNSYFALSTRSKPLQGIGSKGKHQKSSSQHLKLILCVTLSKFFSPRYRVFSRRLQGVLQMFFGKQDLL